MKGKSSVVYDEASKPCNIEYLCIISPFLCLCGQELQQNVNSAQRSSSQAEASTWQPHPRVAASRCEHVRACLALRIHWELLPPR